MENYQIDIDSQFSTILDSSYFNSVKNEFKDELYIIFKHIYLINFLKNRIELEKFFESEYMNISMSCIIESFSLIINNYPRGSSLVLRSSLENFLKHLILKHSSLKEITPNVNDRNYTANKNTYDNIINNHFKDIFKFESKGINSKMESHYKKLSGISHSLVTESRNNLLMFFSDLDNVDSNNISHVLDLFSKIVVCIVENLVILCEPSLKHWEYKELEKLLLIVFGTRKTKTYLTNIKL